MKIITVVLVAVGGVLASIGILQIGALALFGALAGSVATATQKPRRIASWIPSVVIVAAIVTVILADQIGVGTHHYGG